MSELTNETSTLELKELVDNKQFDTIITEYANVTENYSAEALYYIGLAYYMKQEDEMCLKYMDLSLSKDDKDPQPHFIKGITLMYKNEFSQAITHFKTAIALDPTQGKYYCALGDTYNNLDKKDLALQAFIKATAKDEPGDRPFSMIAQIYSEIGDNENALEAYYQAKNNIVKGTKSYVNALFNIGNLEVVFKNYDKAEAALTELLSIAPSDFHTHVKLIQLYYATQQYEKSTLHKDILYKAHRQNLLKENLADKFCFDQFIWSDYTILAYERFQEVSTTIFYKHIFYILNQDNILQGTIQTEYSAISQELGFEKYKLGMNRGEIHYGLDYFFNDNFHYTELKNAVLEVLQNKWTPEAN